MTAQGIITAIIVGAIIGVLGRLVLPGRQNISVLLTVVVGIVAALLGSFIAGQLGVKDTAGIDWIEIAIQVVLAAVGVALVAGTMGRRRVHSPSPQGVPPRWGAPVVRRYGRPVRARSRPGGQPSRNRPDRGPPRGRDRDRPGRPRR